MPNQNQKVKKQNQNQKAVKRVAKSQPRKKRIISEGERCALEYAASLADPFDLSLAPCIPSSPSIPSSKRCCWAKGTGVIGTSGVGWIYGIPVVANDSNFLYVSDVGSTGSSFSTVDGTSIMNNSQLTGLDIAGDTDGARIRIVSFGIRIRYTGTQLNMGGTAVAFEHPIHDTLTGLAMSDLLAYGRSSSQQFDRKWISTTYTPSYDLENQYGSNPYGYTNNNFLGIMCTGVAGMTFEFEAVVHYEAIGEFVRNKSKSPVAPVEAQQGANWVSNLGDMALSAFANLPEGSAVHAIQAMGALTGLSPTPTAGQVLRLLHR